MSNSRTNVELLKALLLELGGQAIPTLVGLLDAVIVDGSGNIQLGATSTKTVTVTGTPTGGQLLPGTWTPTWTGVANVASVTPNLCMYIRVGDLVAFCGSVFIDPTADSTFTSLRGTLPIASNLAAVADLAGVSSRATSVAASLVGQLSADVTNNEILFNFVDGTGNVTSTWAFIGFYRILA
jgi:hypothetical protein